MDIFRRTLRKLRKLNRKEHEDSKSRKGTLRNENKEPKIVDYPPVRGREKSEADLTKYREKEEEDSLSVSRAFAVLPSEWESSVRTDDIRKLFTLEETIGKGNFSVVKRGIKKSTGEIYAIKVIEKNFIFTDSRLKREVTIMRKIKHPNIVPLEDVYEDEKRLYLVLKYIDGGELFERIIAKESGYSEKDARNIVHQILTAIDYLHSKNVVHRDLKPENLLCTGGDEDIHIFVTDFGFSRLLKDKEVLMTQCGSPEYMAPEILECKPYERAVDMWSMGVLTYVLLTGCFPFWNDQPQLLYELVSSVTYVWDEKLVISADAKDFVGKLLVKNPAARMTARDALNHPWITSKVRRSIMLEESKQLLRKTSQIWKAHRENSFEKLSEMMKSPEDL